MRCVLDTCALLWLTLDPESLSKVAAKFLKEESGGLVVSAISFWEIGQKYQKKTLDLGCPPSQYFSLVNRTKEITIFALRAEAALQSTFLDWSHKDPADRLIVQTAIELNLPLVTADQTIHAYYSRCIW